MEQNDFPVEGMTVRPYGMPLLHSAWLGCVRHAIGNADARIAFKGATGRDIEALNGMVEGAEKTALIAAFCDWVTAVVWGVEGQKNPPCGGELPKQ